MHLFHSTWHSAKHAAVVCTVTPLNLQHNEKTPQFKKRECKDIGSESGLFGHFLIFQTHDFD